MCNYEAAGEVEKTKPKRASLAKGMVPAEVTLETALGLLSLPREVGPHPDSGEPITAGIGRFGAYVKHQSTYKSLTDGDDVLTIGLNRAVDLIAQAPQRTPAKALGDHPDDGVPVTIHRPGPMRSTTRSARRRPKVAEDSVTLGQAIELIAPRPPRRETACADQGRQGENHQGQNKRDQKNRGENRQIQDDQGQIIRRQDQVTRRRPRPPSGAATTSPRPADGGEIPPLCATVRSWSGARDRPRLRYSR